MRVKLKRGWSIVWPELTPENVYFVIGIESGDLRLMNDHGEPVLYPPRCFEVVDAVPSPEWIEHGQGCSYPRPLAAVGFFEDLFDGDSESWRTLRAYLRRAAAVTPVRDEGGAIAAFEELIPRLQLADRRTLLVHSYLQMAYMHDLLGEPVERERAARKAVELAPTSDLASMALFHALNNLGFGDEAMDEMVRFLRLRHAANYAELVADLVPEGMTRAQQRCLEEARALILKRS